MFNHLWQSRLRTLAMSVATLLVFCACNQTRSQLQLGAPGTAATQPPLSPTAPPPQARPQVPYSMEAHSAANFIEFKIQNNGITDLPVRPADFALITPEDHSVIPYARDSAIIDLPQPAIAKPGASIVGRAQFNGVSSPIGKRLVFKPDATGTFADIRQ